MSPLHSLIGHPGSNFQTNLYYRYNANLLMNLKVVYRSLAIHTARRTASCFASLLTNCAMVAASAWLIVGMRVVHAAQQTENVNSAVPQKTSVLSDTPSEGAAARAQVEGLSWINQQPKGNYTLQLMAAVSPKPLYKFVRNESLPPPLAMACFKKEGKILHLLLQGSYATRSEAEIAAAQIEPEKGERPWVRKFASFPELFDSNSPPPGEEHEEEKRPLPPIMGAAWVWSRNPVHYTIQLMGDRHADRLHVFVRKQRPATPLASIRVKSKGKPWFLLVEGDYASEEEAIAAIKALPREVKGGGAWPRVFASLQDQMVVGNH